VLKAVASTMVGPFWALINSVVRPIKMKKAWKAPCPVISVGNIVAGGVGKTELVSYLVQFYLKKGISVVVAMRGYGASIDIPDVGLCSENYTDALARKFPDEALVHLRKNPGVKVLIATNRAKALQHFFDQLKPQIIILDDGFQHFSIQRDLDIIIHDFSAKNPIFRDFPGILERKELLLVAHSISKDSVIPKKWRHLNWVKSNYEYLGLKGSSTSTSEKKKAYGFCAIGNPERFKNFLQMQGHDLVGFHSFSDHHNYSRKNVDFLFQQGKANQAEVFLTTLKDYVKLGSFKWINELPLFYVDIQLKISENEKHLLEKINF